MEENTPGPPVQHVTTYKLVSSGHQNEKSV